MSKLFLVFFGTTAFAAAENNDPEGKSPVVLVHGAWQADYVWEETKTELETAGYRVSVVKLPAHGDDNTPAYQTSLKGYVDAVKHAINAYDEPVILVGHSLGGAVITQTASEIPQKISKLVYVAGFIPQSSKSVLDYSKMDGGSSLPAALQLSDDMTLAGLTNPEANIPEVFAQDATAAQKKFLVAHYKAEPTIPMGTPLQYDADAYKAAGEKYYIHTTADRTISYDLQKKMASEAGIANTYTMDSGHSPFVSRKTEFVALLKAIARK